MKSVTIRDPRTDHILVKVLHRKNGEFEVTLLEALSVVLRPSMRSPLISAMASGSDGCVSGSSHLSGPMSFNRCGCGGWIIWSGSCLDRG